MRKPKTVLYRRKREAKTNYAKRLKLLFSQKPRVVVRFTNTKIIAQVVSFTQKGDVVTAAVDSSSLSKMGWKSSLKNFPAAYLTGVLIGKKAQEKGCKEAIMDTGFKNPQKGGKVYAFVKGVVDSGLQVPHSEEIYPAEDRIAGKHLSPEVQSEFTKIKGTLIK